MRNLKKRDRKSKNSLPKMARTKKQEMDKEAKIKEIQVLDQDVKLKTNEQRLDEQSVEANALLHDSPAFLKSETIQQPVSELCNASSLSRHNQLSTSEKSSEFSVERKTMSVETTLFSSGNTVAQLNQISSPPFSQTPVASFIKPETGTSGGNKTSKRPASVFTHQEEFFQTPNKLSHFEKSRSMTFFSPVTLQKKVFTSSLSSPASLPTAVVCVTDICKSPDGDVLKMIKRRSRKSRKDDILGVLNSSHSSKDGDHFESSHKTNCISDGKNIFEQFDTEMVGRRSPRNRSPRGSVSGSLTGQDNSASRSSSEERQLSIASAVKALRSITEKFSENACSKTYGERNEPDSSARKSSIPQVLSPISASTKKCSPSKSTEKMSPPKGGQKLSRTKKTLVSPIFEENSDSSPSPVKRARSSRRIIEDLISLPVISQRKHHSDQEEGGSLSTCAVNEESHAVHILSSTSPCAHLSSQVLQVNKNTLAPKAHRKLFPNTDSISIVRDFNKVTVDKSESSERVTDKQVRQSLVHIKSKHTDEENSKPETTVSDDVESSLLCAMLVGGTEVTKYYEQSREHGHVSSANPLSLQPSTSSNSRSRECLTEDDLSLDIPDMKPYELPVLSHLPPLSNPNLAVLNLPPAGNESDEIIPLSICAKPKSSLSNLISKVTDYLKNSNSANGSVVIEAEEILKENSEFSHRKERDNLSHLNSFVDERASGKTDEGCQIMSQEKFDSQHTRCESDVFDANDHELSSSSDKLLKSSSDISESSLKDCDLVSLSLTSNSERTKELKKVVHLGEQGSLTDVVSQDNTSIPKYKSRSDKSKDASKIDCVERSSTPDGLSRIDTVEITKAVTQSISCLDDKSDDAEEHQNLELQNERTSISKQSDSFLQSQGQCVSASISELSSQKSASSSNLCLPSTSVDGCSGPSRTRWLPQNRSTSSNGRPLWSRWHKIVSPSPLAVLCNPEKPLINGMSAFFSKELDLYLRKPENRILIPAGKNSKLAEIIIDGVHFKDFDELQTALSKGTLKKFSSDDDDGPTRSDEDEDDDDDDDDDKDSESAKKLDPDFDEVSGLVFMSFPSEIAMHAHISVEKALHWDQEANAFLNIAKFRAFEEHRRLEGKIRRESQGLRGQHMRWRKYRRMYRRELRCIQEAKDKGLPWPAQTTTGKTTDISKIKNWKNKFSVSHIKSGDGGHNHSKGKESTGVLKKKKRRTYVFSVKKKQKRHTATVGKTSASVIPQLTGKMISVKDTVEKVDSQQQTEELDTQTKEKMEFLKQTLEKIDFQSKKTPEEMDPSEGYDRTENYGQPIPIDQDGYMNDVHNSLLEMRRKEKGLHLHKGILTQIPMGSEEQYIFKKLGGWLTDNKASKGTTMKMSMAESLELSDSSSCKDQKKYKKGTHKGCFSLCVLNVQMAEKAVTALQWPLDGRRDSHGSCESDELSMLSESGDFMDLTEDDPSPHVDTKHPCDKPGCRYGCICHLCQPTAENDDLDQTSSAVSYRGTCDKEYCRLGCICDSLEKSDKRDAPSHCAKAECIIQCQCKPAEEKSSEAESNLLHDERLRTTKSCQNSSLEKTDTIELIDSSEDELPTLEKTSGRRQRSIERYSNLPRRQTSYRVAKNLDAVSRKAMMLYETSEIYWEQSSNRRKKISDSPGAVTPATLSLATTLSPPYTTNTPMTSSLCWASGLMSSTFQTSTPVTSIVSQTPSTANITAPTPPVIVNRLLYERAKSLIDRSNGENDHLATEASVGEVPKGLLNPIDRHNLDTNTSIAQKNGQNNPASKFESKRSRMKKNVFSRSLDGHSGIKDATSAAKDIPTLPSTTASSSLTDVSVPLTTQWHTSMVCLKANPGSCDKDSKNSSSDDVQEKDEIKLLEFIANCNWSSCKREILRRVAQCLSRGQYPAPRSMQVENFFVEILPKAPQPSIIPQELRNRLPEKMFSIRIRVTLRKTVSQILQPPPIIFPSNLYPQGKVIDLVGSGEELPGGKVASENIPGSVESSGAKTAMGNFPGRVESPGFKIASGNLPGGQDLSSAGNIGISGLGHLQIAQVEPPKKSRSLSGKRESFHVQGQQKGANISSEGDACNVTVDQPEGKKVRKKKKKKKDLEEKINKHTDIAAHTSTNSPIIVPGCVSSAQTLHKFAHPPNIPGVPQFFGPFTNLSDLKFLQIPGQKSLLQLVPASALGLKTGDNKTSPNYLALPVSFAPVEMGYKKGGHKLDLPTEIRYNKGGHKLGVSSNVPSQEVVAKSSEKNSSLLSSTILAVPASYSAPKMEEESSTKKRRKRKKCRDASEISNDKDASSLSASMASAAVCQKQIDGTTDNAPATILSEKQSVSTIEIAPATSLSVKQSVSTTETIIPSASQVAAPFTISRDFLAKQISKTATTSSSPAFDNSCSAVQTSTEVVQSCTGMNVSSLPFASSNSNYNSKTSSQPTKSVVITSELPVLKTQTDALRTEATASSLAAQQTVLKKTKNTDSTESNILDLKVEEKDLIPYESSSVSCSNPADTVAGSNSQTVVQQADSLPNTPATDLACSREQSVSRKATSSTTDVKSPLTICSSSQTETSKYVDEMSHDGDSWASTYSPSSIYSEREQIDEEEIVDVGDENGLHLKTGTCSQCSGTVTTCVCRGKAHGRPNPAEHKKREKNRRAVQFQMFQYLKNILYADDACRKDLPPMSKIKLLAKTILVVKYQQKLNLSLKKSMNVEETRQSMLKRQLESMIGILKRDGATQDSIDACLASVTPFHSSACLTQSMIMAEENKLLHSDNLPAVYNSASTSSPDSQNCDVFTKKYSLPQSLVSDNWKDTSLETSDSVPTSQYSDSPTVQNATREKRKTTSLGKSTAGPKSSEFYIEIERADEDEHFADLDDVNMDGWPGDGFNLSKQKDESRLSENCTFRKGKTKTNLCQDKVLTSLVLETSKSTFQSDVDQDENSNFDSKHSNPILTVTEKHTNTTDLTAALEEITPDIIINQENQFSYPVITSVKSLQQSEFFAGDCDTNS